MSGEEWGGIAADRKKCGLIQSYSRHNPKHDCRRISCMNSSTTDKVKGTAKEVTGKVKEETGKAVGNPNLEDRGTTEKIAGKVERKVGDVKKVFGK
jgi:uncharacterized protein YjbJ (UPF0337 family)